MIHQNSKKTQTRARMTGAEMFVSRCARGKCVSANGSPGAFHFRGETDDLCCKEYQYSGQFQFELWTIPCLRQAYWSIEEPKTCFPLKDHDSLGFQDPQFLKAIFWSPFSILQRWSMVFSMIVLVSSFSLQYHFEGCKKGIKDFNLQKVALTKSWSPGMLDFALDLPHRYFPHGFSVFFFLFCCGFCASHMPKRWIKKLPPPFSLIFQWGRSTFWVKASTPAHHGAKLAADGFLETPPGVWEPRSRAVDPGKTMVGLEDLEVWNGCVMVCLNMLYSPKTIILVDFHRNMMFLTSGGLQFSKKPNSPTTKLRCADPPDKRWAPMVSVGHKRGVSSYQ